MQKSVGPLLIGILNIYIVYQDIHKRKHQRCKSTMCKWPMYITGRMFLQKKTECTVTGVPFPGAAYRAAGIFNPVLFCVCDINFYFPIFPVRYNMWFNVHCVFLCKLIINPKKAKKKYNLGRIHDMISNKLSVTSTKFHLALLFCQSSFSLTPCVWQWKHHVDQLHSMKKPSYIKSGIMQNGFNLRI